MKSMGDIKQEIDSLINSIPDTEKFLLGFCYAYRHKPIIEKFDAAFDENLYGFYMGAIERGYNIYLSQNFNPPEPEAKALIDSCYTHTPDTDEYGTTEGSSAQNAMIILCFTFKYLVDKNSGFLMNCFNKVMETWDNIYYESDPNYSEEPLLVKEKQLLEEYAETFNQHKNNSLINKLNQINNRYAIDY